jgi:hypothetical protein
MRRAIRLALVTHDPQVIAHARELDISTFETIGSSQRGRWKRGRGKVFANRFQKPKDEPEPEELMPVASRVRVAPRVRIPGFARLLIVIVLLLAAGAVVVIAIPTATVTLQAATAPLSASAVITTSLDAPDVDLDNAIIPARRLQVEIRETGERATTGRIDQPDSRATGLVTFINLTGETLDIPAGTIVSTSVGEAARFRTNIAVVLPGGVDQRVEVPIEALASATGPTGNVEAGQINRVEASWAANVNVVNLAATSGGEDRALPSVAERDRDLLLAAVRQQLQSRARAEMEAQISPTEFVIEETVRIVTERPDWTEYSAQVGDPSATLTLRMRAVVEALVVDERQGQRVVFANLSKLIPRGRVLDPASIVYTRGPVTATSETGDVTFSMEGSAIISGQINAGALQERLAGRSLDDALLLLSNTVDIAPGSTPQIVLSPDWFGRMPLLPVRITVRVTEGSP